MVTHPVITPSTELNFGAHGNALTAYATRAFWHWREVLVYISWPKGLTKVNDPSCYFANVLMTPFRSFRDLKVENLLLDAKKNIKIIGKPKS